MGGGGGRIVVVRDGGGRGERPSSSCENAVTVRGGATHAVFSHVLCRKIRENV